MARRKLSTWICAAFLAIAGASVPSELQGESLVPLLKGETLATWRSAFYYHDYEYPGSHDVPRHYGVRTARYKLIHYYHLKEWEFFDLQTDPHELQSRYDDPDYAKLIASHKAELSRLRAQYLVPEDKIPLKRKFRRLGN